MKKFFAAICAACAAVVLAGCSAESAEGPARKPEPAQGGEARPIASSIFGRKVEYSAYTPAEGLSPPIPSGEIEDILRIEKRLYFLGDGAIFALDTETGESERLIETAAPMFAAHGGRLYTYSPEEAALREYDPSGRLLSEAELEIEGADSVEALAVTDGYFVFTCKIAGQIYVETQIFVYSRDSLEQTAAKSAPRTGVRLFPYKGDELLQIAKDGVFGTPILGAFDAKTAKSRKIRELSLGADPAVAYSPKTDTAIVFGCAEALGAEGEQPCEISEFSLADSDSVLLNRYYLNVSQDTEYFVEAYENAVFAVSSTDGGIKVFDFLDPPESITVLGFEVAKSAVYSFEKSAGILIKNAYTDYDRLALKLMAGDDDFDIFYNASGFQNYVESGAFVDLKTVESLDSRISGSEAAKLIVDCGGKYFGVPIGVSNLYDEKNYPEEGGFSYSIVVSEGLYCAKNIDAAEKRFDDPDGSELYKLFKFFNDNPEGNRKKMPFGDEAEVYCAGVYMLNPRAKNRDGAVEFLEYIFDSYSGEISGIIPEEEQYPKFESSEGRFAEWRCRPIEIISPIFEARNKVLSGGGELSSSELKKLAREAAAEVAMRMGE